MAVKKSEKINPSDSLALIKNGLAQLVVRASNDAWKKKVAVTADHFVTPPQSDMGDLSLPCFVLSKELSTNPAVIATELATIINDLITKPIKDKKGDYFEKSIIEKVASAGPYLNFTLEAQGLANLLMENAGKTSYGTSSEYKDKVMAIDMSSPNIAKPLGIGHLRSAIIGNAIAKLYQAQGYKTVKINYLGDWGNQFGKIILAYEKWGDPKKLAADPMGYLYELYVKVSADPELKQASRDTFRRLEEGDKKALALWKKFLAISVKDFNEIYKTIGVKFDIISGESHYNKSLDGIIKQLNKKGLLKKSEGAMIVDLQAYNLGACMIQKTDGTTTYATRDIAAAIDRYKRFHFNTMVYEVGVEQKLHFQQVFKVLELMGYKWASQLTHVDHGLYLGTDGKKFSTRQGKTIFVKDIINELIELAAKEITKRQKLPGKELARRAHAIAIAALLYGDLKNHHANDVIFDFKRFVSFEGDTGPYLLYTYARLKSIIKKAGASKIKIDNSYDWTAEKKVLLELSNYPSILKKALAENAPSVVAKYLHDLAQITSEYYHKTQVLSASPTERACRLKLITSVTLVLKNGLAILGIETLEQM